MSVEYLTVPQAAATAQVDRATIYRMIKRKEIVPTKFGGATRIHYNEIGLKSPPSVDHIGGQIGGQENANL